VKGIHDLQIVHVIFFNNTTMTFTETFEAVCFGLYGGTTSIGGGITV
jgi:hypothetical protein